MAEAEQQLGAPARSSEMDEFAERLGEVIDAQISANSFAKSIGVAESTLRNWLGGRSTPDVDKLVKIAKAAGVRLEWLAAGEGSREGVSEGLVIPYSARDTMPENRLALHHSPKGEPLVPAPGLVYVMISAGARGYVIQELAQPPENLAIRFVRGDEMEPTLKDRGTVLVDTSVTEIASGGIYGFVMAGTDEPIFRRCQRMPEGTVRAKCDNPAYEGFDFKPGGVEVIGKVAWLGHNI